MPSTDNPPETIDAANKNPWTEETKAKFETFDYNDPEAWSHGTDCS